MPVLVSNSNFVSTDCVGRLLYRFDFFINKINLASLLPHPPTMIISKETLLFVEYSTQPPSSSRGILLPPAKEKRKTRRGQHEVL
jgi:hypothetical protein